MINYGIIEKLVEHPEQSNRILELIQPIFDYHQKLISSDNIIITEDLIVIEKNLIEINVISKNLGYGIVYSTKTPCMENLEKDLKDLFVLLLKRNKKCDSANGFEI